MRVAVFLVLGGIAWGVRSYMLPATVDESITSSATPVVQAPAAVKSEAQLRYDAAIKKSQEEFAARMAELEKKRNDPTPSPESLRLSQKQAEANAKVQESLKALRGNPEEDEAKHQAKLAEIKKAIADTEKKGRDYQANMKRLADEEKAEKEAAQKEYEAAKEEIRNRPK